jgi:hypothetical protein
MCLLRWPRKITLDGLRQSHLALRYLRRESQTCPFSPELFRDPKLERL